MLLQGKLQDRMAGGKEEYNAFFYSLVSTDTQVWSFPFVGPSISETVEDLTLPELLFL